MSFFQVTNKKIKALGHPNFVETQHRESLRMFKKKKKKIQGVVPFKKNLSSLLSEADVLSSKPFKSIGWGLFVLNESCSAFTFCQNYFILVFSQPWYLFKFVSYYKPPSKQGGYLSDTWRNAFAFWVSLCLLWTGKNISKQVSTTGFFLFKRTERDKLLYETTQPFTSKLSHM